MRYKLSGTYRGRKTFKIYNKKNLALKDKKQIQKQNAIIKRKNLRVALITNLKLEKAKKK